MPTTPSEQLPARDPQEAEEEVLGPSCCEWCTLRIRELNDEFRRDREPMGARIALGDLVITRGVALLGNDFVNRALEAVRSYTDFTPENDPYGEHDFGGFELDGRNLFWKIDCYDRELKRASPDPSDPDFTRRILTVLLADEN
jgi:hypothetical protein